MHIPFIKQLFSNETASALCWTLIHSLWEGLVFVIAAGIAMMVTKKCRPAIRYNILSVEFLLFIIVSILTFIREWTSRISAIGFQDLVNHHVISSRVDIQPRVFIYDDGKQQFLNKVMDFISLHASLIASIWFVILSVKFVKIISTLLYAQYIRDYRTHTASTYWRDKITSLCKQLQISKPVMLLESEIINIPAVFGHIKPVIFIPLGLLANLPPEQVEASLIHELAHIRRNDYLVNFLQNMAETLFFFNPAVLWISALIREERENCCDDIAIGQTKDKKQFVRALLSFGELSVYNNSKHVIAFSGNRNHLFNRIKRIVLNKNKTLNPVENIFLAGSLVIMSFLTISFSQKMEMSPSKNNSSIKITDSLPVSESVPAVSAKPAVIFSGAKGSFSGKLEINSPNGIVRMTGKFETISPLLPQKSIDDTLPPVKGKAQKALDISSADGDLRILEDISADGSGSGVEETIIADYNGIIYKIIKVNKAITKLYVDGEIISNEKISNYQGVIGKIDEQVERMRAEQEIRNKEQEQRNVEQAKRNKEQELRNAEQAVKNKEQEQRNAEQAIRNKEQERMNAEQAKRDKAQEQRNADQAMRNKEQERIDAEQAIRDKAQEQRDLEQAIRNKEQEQRNLVFKSIIDDLLRENIIKDSKSLRSFTLNTEVMIVNGERQPSEVHERFKKKYLKSPADQYNYQNY